QSKRFMGAVRDRILKRFFPQDCQAIEQRQSKWREIENRCGELNTRMIFPDALQPTLLSQMSAPPQALFVQGAWEALLNKPCIGVVGTRAPSASGVRAARTFGSLLARSGWVVVSGLARGVDGIAHLGAL